jgi:AbiV family abortive infection protein
MKKERNLLKLLSDKECLNASREALINSDNHKQSAVAIAKKRNYGLAVSLLILSTEELTKALLLYIQHLGIDIRNIPRVQLFFTDHVIKHRLAIMTNSMYPILKLIIGFVSKEAEKLNNPEAIVKHTNEEIALMSLDENKIKNLFKDLPEMIDWWDEANMMKNKGLYVDYTTSLETPMQVTELEYKQAFKISNNFQKQISDILSHLDKLTEEEKQDIAKKSYKIDEILIPIIEWRREEMKNKGKS